MDNMQLIKRPNLNRACDEAGGQTALATKIGESQKLIWHLLNRAGSIKANVALKISDATGIPFADIVSDFSNSPEAE